MAEPGAGPPGEELAPALGGRGRVVVLGVARDPRSRSLVAHGGIIAERPRPRPRAEEPGDSIRPRMRDDGEIGDDALRTIERELDLDGSRPGT
ncbi:MAG: hypothetical protein BroJett022_23890 [Actinomycetes bacterium]|nr:MAG: hypothetical protein BroJett022_23890 [Actinomycetes bacterium]